MSSETVRANAGSSGELKLTSQQCDQRSDTLKHDRSNVGDNRTTQGDLGTNLHQIDRTESTSKPSLSCNKLKEDTGAWTPPEVNRFKANSIPMGCGTSMNRSGKDNCSPQVSSGNRTLLENGLCTPTRLPLIPRSEAYCVDDKILNLPRNNPCCRYAIVVGNVLLEACIDSGATLCLLSNEAYQRIKHIAGPIQPTKRRASGAGGEKLDIKGWVKFPFRIGASNYTYSFLVGNLSGIDCLLGLDWLMSVGALIDFASMQAEFGPKVKVQLSTEPLQINFCKVVEGQVLAARAHTVVNCRSDFPVDPSGALPPAIFEPSCIRLGPGLSIAASIVQPDEDGNFCITIQNDNEFDWELPGDVLIGSLDELQTMDYHGLPTNLALACRS